MDSPVKPIDVVIIGGGPAGLSAALWCAELGLGSVLIEQERGLGGQLRHVYNPIDNYLGIRAANGLEMLSLFEKSVGSRNFVPRLGIKASSIDFAAMEVRVAGLGGHEERLSFRALILATGVRRRVLGIPGEIDFRGRGILESGSRDKEKVSGKRVLIIGGGDAAFENALILSEHARTVRVAYRRAAPTARRAFVDATKHRDNVEHISGMNITRILGDSSVERVESRDSSGQTRTEPIDAVLIRIGVEPNSELVSRAVDLEESGYIKVDHKGETSIPGVDAVGDVAHFSSPTLSTAVGTGTTAAKSIFHSINKLKQL
ncbi:MAG: NAD(P)/FAD-dependent oxidoreductase [Acidobacteriota bacterium]